MSFLKLVTFTILCLECFAQTPRKANQITQSTPRKNAFNSMLDSIINAFHPADSTEKPIVNIASNALWQFEIVKNGTTPSLFEDVITTTEDSLLVTQVIWDTGEEPELPSEGFFDPYINQQDRNLRPIIKGLLNYTGLRKPVREKPKRKPNGKGSKHFKSSSLSPNIQDKITFNALTNLPWRKSSTIKLASKSEIKSLSLVFNKRSVTELPSLYKETSSPDIPSVTENIGLDNRGQLLSSKLFQSKNESSSKEPNKTTTGPTYSDNQFDEFKPVKPDLNVPLQPEKRPDFDIEALLGKLNKLISTSTTSSSIKATSNSINDLAITIHTRVVPLYPFNTISKPTEEPTFFGPISTQTTQMPIIGPLNTPSILSNEHGESNRKSREGYNMNKVDLPLNLILDKFDPTTSTNTSTLDLNSTMGFISREINQESQSNLDDGNESDQNLFAFNVSEIASTSTTKKRMFPWPISRKKPPVSTSTTTSQNSEASGPDDKLQDYKPREINTSSSNSISLPISSTERTTLKFEPSTTNVKRHVFPTIKFSRKTIKPRMPFWLSNILAILPTTSKPVFRSTKALFPMKTTKNKQDNFDKDSKFEENTTEKTTRKGPTSYLNNNQGFNMGNNSGQGLSGIGNNNGQGGVMIGSNSGIGKRPSKKPYVAKPLVVSITKPIMVTPENPFEE